MTKREINIIRVQKNMAKKEKSHIDTHLDLYIYINFYLSWMLLPITLIDFPSVKDGSSLVSLALNMSNDRQYV